MSGRPVALSLATADSIQIRTNSDPAAHAKRVTDRPLLSSPQLSSLQYPLIDSLRRARAPPLGVRVSSRFAISLETSVNHRSVEQTVSVRYLFQKLALRCALAFVLLSGCSASMAQSGPVGWWKLDEGSGTSAADSSTYANSGTLVSSPVWATGRVGPYALTFNGTTNYVNVPNASGSLDNLQATAMTLSAWIKPTGTGGGGGGRIIEKGGWFLAMAATPVVRLTCQDTGGYRNSTTIALNTWTHVTATWDGLGPGSGMHLYINGVAADGTANAGTGSPGSDVGSASIGNRASDQARGFAGTIDDVRVYNRVLSAAEILALADSTAPSAPGGLGATAPSGSQVNLNWTASTDSVGVTGYLLERCQGAGCSSFAQIAAPTTTAYSDTGLTPATSYTYRVRATDANTNLSAYSTSSTVTTPSGADTTPPSTPASLSATAASSSQMNLSWTASTDNVGVTGYRVERCQGASCTTFAQIATPATTTYSDTGLSASTNYSYRVRATDAAGNLSGYSNTASATTSAASSSTIAYVQSNSASPNNSALATLSAAFTSAQSAGNLNVVAIGWGSSTIGISSVTDTKGNSYTLAVGPTTMVGGGATTTIYYAKNIVAAAAGANTVTVTFSSAVPFPDIRMAEYSGISTTNPLDVTATATGTSTLANSGSVTTTNANDLLVGSNWFVLGTTSAGAGYTQRQISGWDGDILEDQIVSTVGPYSATAPITTSSAWIMQMAAFRAAGSVADTTPPSTPAGLASPAKSDSQINLTWTASTDDVGVTNYLIERCLTSTCTFAQIASNPSATYVDTSVTAATSYNYRVRATDAGGNLSQYSNTTTAATSAAVTYTCPTTGSSTVCYFYDEAGRLKVVQHDNSTRQVYVLDAVGNRASVNAKDTTIPSVPTGLAGQGVSATQINLTWTASTDAGISGVAGYTIYRGGTQIGTSTTASYSDTAGLVGSTGYTYTVAAYDSSGNSSVQSAPVTVYTVDITAPSVPTGLVATAVGVTQINLTWQPSTDSPPVGAGGSGVSNYKIYRDESTQALGTTSSANYPDTSVLPGSTHTYRVAAFDGAGNNSGLSASAGATTPTIPPPSVPTGLAATPVAWNQINLSWNTSTDTSGPGLAGYKLYRNSTLLAQPTGTTFNDTTVSCTGGAYSYSVASYDTAGRTSAQSAAVAASTPDQLPPTTPTGLATVPSTTSGQIYMSWNPATDTCGSVAGYEIARNGTIVATQQSIAFNDTGLALGTTYSYTVRSYDAAGNRSPYSSAVTGTTPPPPPSTPVWTYFDWCVRASGCIPENQNFTQWQDTFYAFGFGWVSTGTVTRYVLEIADNSPFTDQGGNPTSAYYTLLPYHNAQFRVKACNATGCSAYSPEISASVDWD